jgi:ATP-binding cassette subfamily B protein
MLSDADAILVIDRGRIADLGHHDVLMKNCTAYRQLWNQQMK